MNMRPWIIAAIVGPAYLSLAISTTALVFSVRTLYAVGKAVDEAHSEQFWDVYEYAPGKYTWHPAGQAPPPGQQLVDSKIPFDDVLQKYGAKPQTKAELP